MMNKYITALFIVLAATGVEAQTYQSVLKVAVKHSSLEDFCNHLELKGLGALFNPLALFLIPSVIKSIRHKKSHWWWSVWSVSIIIGLIGRFFQQIPVPILIVALFLLFNCIFHQWLIRHIYITAIERK